MNREQMLKEIRWVIRSKIYYNWVPVSIDIMERKAEYYANLSLSRVLSALWDKYIYKQQSLVDMIVYDEPIESEKYYLFDIPRKLLNEDWSDAMLDDQSDETIETLYELLVRK